MAIKKTIDRSNIDKIKQTTTTQLNKVLSTMEHLGEKALKAVKKIDTLNFNQEHIVQSGETLSEIAKKYNLTYQELAEYNNISDANYIEVGQVIQIPEINHQESTKDDNEYTVQSGETLSEIAKKYNLTYQELAEYNNISDANYIEVGQTIKIPPTEESVNNLTNEFIANLITNGSKNFNDLVNTFAAEIAKKINTQPNKSTELLNNMYIKIKESIEDKINVTTDEMKKIINQIQNEVNNNLKKLKEHKINNEINQLSVAIKDGAKNLNELINSFTINIANEIDNVSNYQEIIRNIEKQLIKIFSNTTIKVANVINQIQTNVLENNMENYQIQTHDHIDNTEGERDKRIAYLTDGYSLDNLPPESEIAKKMTTITIPIWTGEKLTERNLIVNQKLANQVKAIFKEIADKKYPIEFAEELDGGKGNYEVEGYEYRPTGSGRLSDHSYGGAIDINAVHNPQTGPRDALTDNDGSEYVVNEDIIEIFAKYGFYWGGDWNSSCDPMHFSFTGY